MTEDELDLLASAYLDGEATPEEVALVERDPDLLARVRELRAVSRAVEFPVVPPPALKEQHLSAAMAAFDADHTLDGATERGRATDGDGAAGNAAATDDGPTESQVLDFQARAKAQATADSMNQVRPVRVGGLPSWLPAAAVFILISGGIIALISTNGSDDSETATEAADTSTEEADAGSDDAEDFAGDSVAAEAELSERSVESDEAAADEEEAMEDEAMADDDAESSEEAAPAPSQGEGDGAGDEDVEPQATTTSAGGFFPEEPVLIFDELPTDLLAELAQLPELRDVGLSNCVDRLELEGGLPLGYVPVELAGLSAELFRVTDSAGVESGLLVEVQTCVSIE